MDKRLLVFLAAIILVAGGIILYKVIWGTPPPVAQMHIDIPNK
jgi:hypothetical protein